MRRKVGLRRRRIQHNFLHFRSCIESFPRASSAKCVIIKTRKNIKARQKLLEMVTSLGLQGFNSRNASRLGQRTVVIFMFMARGTLCNNNLHKDYNKNSLTLQNSHPARHISFPVACFALTLLFLAGFILQGIPKRQRIAPFASQTPTPPIPSLQILNISCTP